MQKLEVSTSVEVCNWRVPKERGKKGVPESPLGGPLRWQVIQEINNGLKVINPNVNFWLSYSLISDTGILYRNNLVNKISEEPIWLGF